MSAITGQVSGLVITSGRKDFVGVQLANEHNKIYYLSCIHENSAVMYRGCRIDYVRLCELIGEKEILYVTLHPDPMMYDLSIKAEFSDNPI